MMPSITVGVVSMTNKTRIGSWISVICAERPVRKSLVAPSITPNSETMLWGSFDPQP